MNMKMLYFLCRNSESDRKMICLYCGHSVIAEEMLYSCCRHSVCSTMRYGFNKGIANYLKGDMHTAQA